MFAAEEISAQRREQRINFSPAEEGEGAEDHEHFGIRSEADQAINSNGLQPKGQRHGFLAANVVGNPAPERTAKAIDYAVCLQRKWERNYRKPQNVDSGFIHFEVQSHGCELSGSHQASSGHHGHHYVHHPELGR